MPTLRPLRRSKRGTCWNRSGAARPECSLFCVCMGGPTNSVLSVSGKLFWAGKIIGILVLYVGIGFYCYAFTHALMGVIQWNQ